MLSHLRNLKPILHFTRIGEPIYYRNVLFLSLIVAVLLRKLCRPLATTPVLIQNLSLLWWQHCQTFLTSSVTRVSFTLSESAP